jgi:hypothetical protein
MFAPAFRRLAAATAAVVALMVLSASPKITPAGTCPDYPTCSNVEEYYQCCATNRMLSWGLANGQFGYCIANVDCEP